MRRCIESTIGSSGNSGPFMTVGSVNLKEGMMIVVIVSLVWAKR